jgi:iron complex transport system permease protein
LAWGAAGIALSDLLRILASRAPGITVEQNWPMHWERIVWDIRLPRVLLAGLVGATLAFAGATYQGVLRNPLADPYLIGVAAGAGLGATLAFLLPVQFSFYALSPVPMFAFVGAMTAVTIAYRSAKTGTKVPTTTLILAGVAISSLASAVMLFLFMLAGDNLRTIFSWIMGSLNASTWDRVYLLVPYTTVMGLVVLVHGRVLNVMQLNEEQAQQVGVDVERVKVILILAASIGTAAAVSVSGLIGFVGLVVPHMISCHYRCSTAPPFSFWQIWSPEPSSLLRRYRSVWSLRSAELLSFCCSCDALAGRTCEGHSRGHCAGSSTAEGRVRWS